MLEQSVVNTKRESFFASREVSHSLAGVAVYRWRRPLNFLNSADTCVAKLTYDSSSLCANFGGFLVVVCIRRSVAWSRDQYRVTSKTVFLKKVSELRGNVAMPVGLNWVCSARRLDLIAELGSVVDSE